MCRKIRGNLCNILALGTSSVFGLVCYLVVCDDQFNEHSEDE